MCIRDSPATAQVTHWRIVKGPAFQQTADDTPPAAASSWSVCAFVETADPGDAASVTISGGGIAGSLPFTLDDGEWILEMDFPTAAAMNALFPSATAYTIQLSGGALGTLSQTASFGPEQYPNTPYLTGSTFTDVQSYEPSAPFTLTWNDPGPLTQISGVSVFEVFDANDDDVFTEVTVGGATSATVAACTLPPSQVLEGFLEFTNAMLVPGAGGFGLDGTSSHNVGLDFAITTTAGPAAVETQRLGSPPNPAAFQAGVSSGPVLGASWDPVIDHASFAADAILDVVIVDVGPPINVPFGSGTLLCSIPAPELIFTAAPGAPFAIPVPDVCALAGLAACSQGASVSPTTGLVLANALDLVFGLH